MYVVCTVWSGNVGVEHKWFVTCAFVRRRISSSVYVRNTLLSSGLFIPVSSSVAFASVSWIGHVAALFVFISSVISSPPFQHWHHFLFSHRLLHRPSYFVPRSAQARRTLQGDLDLRKAVSWEHLSVNHSKCFNRMFSQQCHVNLSTHQSHAFYTPNTFTSKRLTHPHTQYATYPLTHIHTSPFAHIHTPPHVLTHHIFAHRSTPTASAHCSRRLAAQPCRKLRASRTTTRTRWVRKEGMCVWGF